MDARVADALDIDQPRSWPRLSVSRDDEVAVRAAALGLQGAEAREPARAEAARPRALLSLVLHGAVLAAVVLLQLSAKPLPEIAATPIALVVVDAPGSEPAAVPPEPDPAPQAALASPAPPEPAVPPVETVEPAPVAAIEATVEAALPPPVEPLPEPVAIPPPRPTAKPRAPVLAAPAPAANAATGPVPAAASPAQAGSSTAPLRTGPTHGVTVLERPAPAYPATARRRRLEGETLLRIEIAADGAAREVVVRRSSGHPVLDEAAVEAARRWRFVPAMRDGAPVAADVELPVLFRLTD